jgi:hypothetical protein
MSLPACEQRVLDRIEASLHAGEPHLTSMFATFARLVRDEGKPRTEELASRSRRPRSRPEQLRAAGRPASDARRRSTPRGRPAEGRPARQVRAVTLILIVLAAAVSAALLGMNANSAGACGPAGAVHRSGYAFSRAGSCQAAESVLPRGHGR